MAPWVASAGLVLDIIGVLLLWRFGLPESISRTGAQHMILEQTDEAEVNLARKYDRHARIGIGLIVAGFGLQILALWLPT